MEQGRTFHAAELLEIAQRTRQRVRTWVIAHKDKITANDDIDEEKNCDFK